MPFDNKIPDLTWFLTCPWHVFWHAFIWHLACFWHAFWHTIHDNWHDTWHDSWHLFWTLASDAFSIKIIYLFTTLLQQQKITAKYSSIYAVFRANFQKLLFLELNKPEIQHILAYLAITFFCSYNRVTAIKMNFIYFNIQNYKNYKETSFQKFYIFDNQSKLQTP